MAAEPSRLALQFDISGAPAETTADVPRRPQCCSEPPLGLVALVPAAGRSRLVAARGRARRPAEPLLEVRSCCSHDKPALHPDHPAARRQPRARGRPCASCPPTCSRPWRRSCASAIAGPGFLLESVERGQQVGRYSFMAAGCEPLELDAASGFEPLRSALARHGDADLDGPAAVLRRRRRLPRLRRGLGLRAERAAAARARRRRRGARALPLRARRGRVRPRPADAAGRRAARLRPGRGRALRRPARARCPPASSRCRP